MIGIIRGIYRRHKKTIVLIVSSILLLSTITGLATRRILTNRQTYVASVFIKYTSPGASDGYAFDGTPINIDEILGPEVLTRAVKAAEIDGLTSDELATFLSIETVIPQDEQDKIDSALKNGKEYEYYPVEYKITMDSPYAESGRILSNIANSYLQYYSEQHVLKNKIPAVLDIAEDYDLRDFLDNAETIRKNTEAMISFLELEASSNPDFRSSSNGYSFSDLLSEYKFINDNYISSLYANIFLCKASTDAQLLAQEISKTITDNKSYITDTNNNLEEIEKLIKSYSLKNKADGEVSDGFGSLPIDENHANIIDDVYENLTNPVSAYDSLVNTFTSLSDYASFLKVENEYQKYILDSMNREDGYVLNNAKENEINELIEFIKLRESSLYENVKKAKEEQDDITSASVLSILNTPVSQKKLRVTMYSVIASFSVIMCAFVILPLLYIFRMNILNYFKNRPYMLEEEE